MKTLPLYLIADAPDLSGEFIIRTQFPRFIGRLLEDDVALAEIVLDLGNGEAVEIEQWIDSPQPIDALIVIIDEIRQAIEEHEEALDV